MRARMSKSAPPCVQGWLQKWGEPPAGTRRWQPMDRLCLTLVCGGIVLLVTALSLTAPEGSPRDRADVAILLNGVQR